MTTEPGKIRCGPVGVVLLALSLAGCGPSAPEDDGPTARAAVLGGVPLADLRIGAVERSWVPGLEDEVYLHAGFDIEAWRVRLVVTEFTSPTVKILYPDLTLDREIGGRGEGPGEFASPHGATAMPDGRLAIIDSGNARITVLDSLARTVATAPWVGSAVASIGALPDTRFAFGVTLKDAGDLVFSTPDSAWATGPVPDDWDISPDAVIRVDLESGPALLRLRSDGDVELLDADGVPIREIAFPEPWKAAAREHRVALRGSVGIGPGAADEILVKSELVRFPGERFGIWMSGGLEPLILVDPATGTWSRPELPDDPFSRDLLEGVTAATVLDGRLYVLGPDRIDVFPLETR